MKNKQELLPVIESLQCIQCENRFYSYVISWIVCILQGLYDGRVSSLREDIKRFADNLPIYADTI